jgi:hypothetical protein
MKMKIEVEKGSVYIEGKLMGWKNPLTIEGEIDSIPEVSNKSTVMRVGKRRAVEVVVDD